MIEKFQRGKQQVLYNYLPGRVIDFGNTTVFAKIRSVTGERFDEVNKQVLINKIRQQARAWDETYRPGLENRVFDDLSSFSVINPKAVKADLFPLVFLCENPECNRLIDYSKKGPPSNTVCPSCNQKTLVQFRFIKAHQCGHLEEIKPPKCTTCNSDKNIAVRGLLQFERFKDFQWICKKCNTEIKFWGGVCPSCDWTNKETGTKFLDVMLFRASRQYYVHSATLINIPKNNFDTLLDSNHWHIEVGAKYLNIPSIKDKKLKDISDSLSADSRQKNKIGMQDSLDLIKKVKEGKMTIEEVEQEMKKRAETPDPTTEEYKLELIKMSGLEESYWKGTRFSILDAVIPKELGNINSLRNDTNRIKEHNAINALGIQDIQLIDDFPIVTASFGYSRLSYKGDEAWLRTFEAEGEHKGKIPIYVDTVEADALYFQIDYERVIRWLKVNGMNPNIPNGSDTNASLKSYFVRLFSNIDTYRTVTDNREGKYVLSLLHTLSHLAIRRAELLCGLERTSVSEYLIPSTLSFALYCNHRFGATIGALTSLFDQALLEWLELILDRNKCVYDPVCHKKMGNCHACTHLPETSCRHFNLNLGRVYLFGGTDNETGNIIKGYFDKSL